MVLFTQMTCGAKCLSFGSRRDFVVDLFTDLYASAAVTWWVESAIKIQTAEALQRTVNTPGLRCFRCFYSVFTNKKHVTRKLCRWTSFTSAPSTAVYLNPPCVWDNQLSWVQPEMTPAEYKRIKMFACHLCTNRTSEAYRIPPALSGSEIKGRKKQRADE